MLAVERLIALLDDRDPVVVQAAARALGSIGNVRAAEGLMAAVGSAGADNFLSICEGLGRAAESLAAQGQRDIALSIYSQAYEDSELPQQVRVASLRGAVLLRGREGVALLREQLRASDYLLFAAAVQLAQELPEPAVTPALVAEVGNLAPDRKQVVIQALGERRDPAALPALLTATTGSSQPVRLAAVRALGSLSHTDAIPTLSRLTADADQEIAQAAKESLASLEGREVDAAALKLLASAEASERLTGVELIGRRRMTGSVSDLLKAAGDADRRVRVAAVRQVGELGSAAQVPAVLALLTKATDGQDRGAAEQALTTLAAKAASPESASAPVIAALGSAQPEAKMALLNVLASIGGAGALKAVSASAKDGNAEVRAEAVRALSSWKTADAGPALAELAKTAASEGDKTLALRGYLGLAANPDLPAEQRFKMCQDAGGLIQRPEEKRLLLAALGSVATPEALKLVVPHLDDPAIREEASAAVVGIADRLLRGQGPNPAAAGLIEPLGKVAQVSGNADLVRRAKELAERAKNRANR
ncbi:MAG: HEAT repeat domain-containing protein [Verrucomicrobia bacterium]|nr:HEAT repeat domain-containing protein [Verrucomicrobiota bacterium]